MSLEATPLLMMDNGVASSDILLYGITTGYSNDRLSGGCRSINSANGFKLYLKLSLLFLKY
jgi:hypothetical protein